MIRPLYLFRNMDKYPSNKVVSRTSPASITVKKPTAGLNDKNFEYGLQYV